MTPRTGPPHEWRQLVAAAVLGMDRLSGRLPAISGSPAALCAQIAPDPSALIRTAGVLAIYERAGRRPIESPTVIKRCADDTIPSCSPRSGQHLARILHGEFGFLLEEWCALAATRGVRAPDELLPALLDRLAVKPQEAGNHGRKALGGRGEWLAVQNPAWRTVVLTEDPRTAWQTGEALQRIAMLHRLRGSDPRAARELATHTWGSESADHRVEIVQALATGLSAEDEAFLEIALDDGRKPVRQAAAELLCRLPTSAFCRRMVARATALITLAMQKRMLRRSKLRIEVTLPDKPDKALLRDGIENKRGGGMGERAYALCQIVAATPLTTWTACGATPEEIIAASEATEWREPLTAGWTLAATRQRAAEWAGPLLRIVLESKDDFDPEFAARLLFALDPTDRERIMSDLLCGEAIDHSRSIPLLESCRHPWSEDFSRKALAAMRGFFGTREAYSAHALRNTFKQFVGRYFAPSIAAEVETGWNRNREYWHKGDEELVSALATTLAFRRTMQEELRQ